MVSIHTWLNAGNPSIVKKTKQRVQALGFGSIKVLQNEKWSPLLCTRIYYITCAINGSYQKPYQHVKPSLPTKQIHLPLPLTSSHIQLHTLKAVLFCSFLISKSTQTLIAYLISSAMHNEHNESNKKKKISPHAYGYWISNSHKTDPEGKIM